MLTMLINDPMANGRKGKWKWAEAEVEVEGAQLTVLEEEGDWHMEMKVHHKPSFMTDMADSS